MTDLERFEIIYNDFFKRQYEDTCYVFLCGGSADNCIRNKIRLLLESNEIQVLYPEDLFMEMMNRNKKTNLLDYENLLAKSADSILLICESMGSAAELGAFVQIESIKNKLLVGIEKKYCRQHSFIMDGPVKKLKTLDKKNRVIIYDKNNISEFNKHITNFFKSMKRKKHLDLCQKTDSSFSLLPEYISFIPMLIYFYQEINRKVLFTNLKELIKKQYNIPKDYNELFNASLRYLHKLGIIVTLGNVSIENNINDQIIKLSDKGYYKTYNLINNSYIFNKNKLYDRIRCDILKEQFNK